jgi:hypothetical protein
VVDLVHRSVHFWLNHRRTGVISHRYPIIPASRRPTVSFFRFSIFVLFGFFNFRSRSHFVPPCYLVTVRVSSSSGFVDRLLSISHFVSFFLSSIGVVVFFLSNGRVFYLRFQPHQTSELGNWLFFLYSLQVLVYANFHLSTKVGFPCTTGCKNFKKGRARAIFREGGFRRFSFKGGAFFLFRLFSFLLLLSWV